MFCFEGKVSKKEKALLIVFLSKEPSCRCPWTTSLSKCNCYYYKLAVCCSKKVPWGCLMRKIKFPFCYCVSQLTGSRLTLANTNNQRRSKDLEINLVFLLGCRLEKTRPFITTFFGRAMQTAAAGHQLKETG